MLIVPTIAEPAQNRHRGDVEISGVIAYGPPQLCVALPGVSMFKLLFRLISLGLFIAPFALTMLAIERTPLVAGQDRSAFDDIGDAKDILKRFDPRMMSDNATTKVSVTDDEISMAIAAALSRFTPLAAKVYAAEDGVTIQGTAELPIPNTFLGRYINIEAVIATSDSELVVSQLSIGALPIPSWIIKPVTITLLDWFMGAGKGAPTYAAIRSVDVDGNLITVAFQPPANLVADLKNAAGNALHLGNAEAVRAYYGKLTEVSLSSAGGQSISLSSYMGPLFALAKTRSQSASPVDENRALILALAMYFGDSRFELLLRSVNTADLSDGNFDSSDVKLERRHDWVQHFVTTAGIQVAAGSGISNFIGEAKEVSDAEGPSGFSFTDIAADRAGVRFAEVATASASSARKLQEALAGRAAESDFFPKVSDLPEGLSEGDFKSAYGDLNTAAYNAMIAAIDKRIAKVALYK